MAFIRRWLRNAGAISKTDAILKVLQIFCLFYQIGFLIYLPASKYLGWASPERYRWFITFIFAFIYGQVFPYLPRTKSKKWHKAEISRLKSTNVAISQITACIRENRFQDADLLDISGRLLKAIQLEVEALVVDSEGIYINATLMIEDVVNPDNLRVLNRAKSDRANPSYPKKDLLVWAAMEEKQRKYLAECSWANKDYHCILALPIVIENIDGAAQSIGVVSIDSGRQHDFDDIDEQIETRLLPYVSLLKLLLSLEKV
jgi:hypothetical protein